MEQEIEKEILVQRWVTYNAKLLSMSGFEVDSGGIKPDDFFLENKKECLKAWRDYVGVKEKEKSENVKKARREKKERIAAFRAEYKQIKPKTYRIPVAIKQLAELHLMASFGEITPETFCKAFYARFYTEIQKAKNKRRRDSNYGWNDINWDKLEKNPIVSQLIA